MDQLELQAKEIDQFLNALPREKIEEISRRNRYESDKAHRKFIRKLRKGKCFLCRKKLDDFTESEPCMHWLLRPKGFDKRHAMVIFQKFNYLRIQSYLRWLANTELPAGNINDLLDEKNPDKLFEYTIRYKNLEWSFSCSKSDLNGHPTAFGDATKPHYHFQMRIDGKPFIDYGNLHVPFTDIDFWHLPIMLNMVAGAGYANYHGTGMQDMMFNVDPEDLLNSMQKSANDERGVYSLQTLVEAEPGKGISGVDLSDLFEKHKKTGVPMAKLIQDMENVGTAITYITPGPSVPDQAGRKSGNKKR
jgi:hypothetical protein